MNQARKAFAIVLLVLTLPIWLLQLSVRNLLSFDTLYEFNTLAETYADVQLFQFEEVYNAGRFLNSIAGFAKFFEALIIPLGIVAAIVILQNSTKKKITLIPGGALLLIILFNLFSVIVAISINNIEIIDSVAEVLHYQNVDVNRLHPVITPITAIINSALIAIPAIGFLACGILDILSLKQNPEEKISTPNLKKARIFYSISAIAVVALLLVASFVSAGFNVATITWIFRYFWQGYFLFVIVAIVFYIIASKINPNKKAKKANSEPVQISIQQVSTADELKKFKELLDSGVITQEEFEAKKKHLLGL